MCRAMLAGAETCRRCKADLSGVRAAERAAVRLEALAMRRLAAGDVPAAARLLRRALRFHRTPIAARLLAALPR